MYGVSDFDKPSGLERKRTVPPIENSTVVGISSSVPVVVASNVASRRGTLATVQKKERTSVILRNWKLKAIVLMIVLGQVYLLTKYSGWTTPVKVSLMFR